MPPQSRPTEMTRSGERRQQLEEELPPNEPNDQHPEQEHQQNHPQLAHVLESISQYRSSINDLVKKHKRELDEFNARKKEQVRRIRKECIEQRRRVARQYSRYYLKLLRLHKQKEEYSHPLVRQLRRKIGELRGRTQHCDHVQQVQQAEPGQGRQAEMTEFWQHILQEQQHRWMLLQTCLEVRDKVQQRGHALLWHDLLEGAELRWIHQQTEVSVLWQHMNREHEALKRSVQEEQDVESIIALQRQTLREQLKHEQDELWQVIRQDLQKACGKFKTTQKEYMLSVWQILIFHYAQLQGEKKLLEEHHKCVWLHERREQMSDMQDAEEEESYLWKHVRRKMIHVNFTIRHELMNERRYLARETKDLCERVSHKIRNLMWRIRLARFHLQ